jgi:hypothetical protein
MIESHVDQHFERPTYRTCSVGRWVHRAIAAVLVVGICASASPAQEKRDIRDAFGNVRVAQEKPQPTLLQRIFSGIGNQEDERPVPPQSQLQQPGPALNRGIQVSQPADEGISELPSPVVKGRLPMAGSVGVGEVRLSQGKDGMIQLLVVRDASLSRVLTEIAHTYNLNVVASNDIDAVISITLRNVPMEEALTAILSVANYTWVRRNDIILVTSLTDRRLPAEIQGRQIQVFDLDFASADLVAEAVRGFLSPIGQVFISESSAADNRRTRELVVVEDTFDALSRIAVYIDQIDQPPRQVQIEAHILQVELSDQNRNGVDFAALFRIAGQTVNVLSVPSLSVPLPPPGSPPEPTVPALLATFSGTDITALVDLLQTTTDAKTLGSPKLLVLNEQEAHIQVGEKLGFRVTTTTETSSLESVEFLDVGVLLRITPRITRDNRILLHVRPEVSTGQVNPATGLPEQQTTELETDVMLDDGQGMIIGGLIKESDVRAESKVPYLGNLWGVGKLFRQSDVTKERTEVIVALVPRIRPYDPEWQAYEQGELVRAQTSLVHGPLCRTERPWEPSLPNANNNGTSVFPLPGPAERRYAMSRKPPSPYYVPRKPAPVQQFYDPRFDPPCETDGIPMEEIPPPVGNANPWNDVQIISDEPSN